MGEQSCGLKGTHKAIFSIKETFDKILPTITNFLNENYSTSC